jgi:hypothetical protein
MRWGVFAASEKRMRCPVEEEGRRIILHLQQGIHDEGAEVPLVKLCRWFGVPWWTVYYRPVKFSLKLQDRLKLPIKDHVEREPSFGYRTVAGLLGLFRNTVQRIFPRRGWQVRKRVVGHRPRVQSAPLGHDTPQRTLGHGPLLRLCRGAWLEDPRAGIGL